MAGKVKKTLIPRQPQGLIAIPGTILALAVGCLVLGIIFLDCAIENMFEYNSRARHALSCIIYALFSIVVQVYAVVTEAKYHKLYNYWAIIALDTILLFWSMAHLVVFALLIDPDCQCFVYFVPGTVISGVQCILLIMYLTIFGIAVIRHERAGDYSKSYEVCDRCGLEIPSHDGPSETPAERVSASARDMAHYNPGHPYHPLRMNPPYCGPLPPPVVLAPLRTQTDSAESSQN